MFSLHAYRAQWFGNIRGDLLAGLVVALALIPEAIAFSIIAGVDPKVGLYASFSIAVITAITGGRPGMISAATAATAVLMVTLVRDHGLQYLLAATVLAGLIQIAAGRAEAGLRDALRVEIGDDGLRQCAGDPDLHGAAAGA
jgi:SulP family sulfate permease